MIIWVREQCQCPAHTFSFNSLPLYVAIVVVVAASRHLISSLPCQVPPHSQPQPPLQQLLVRCQQVPVYNVQRVGWCTPRCQPKRDKSVVLTDTAPDVIAGSSSACWRRTSRRGRLYHTAHAGVRLRGTTRLDGSADDVLTCGPRSCWVSPCRSPPHHRSNYQHIP